MNFPLFLVTPSYVESSSTTFSGVKWSLDSGTWNMGKTRTHYTSGKTKILILSLHYRLPLYLYIWFTGHLKDTNTKNLSTIKKLATELKDFKERLNNTSSELCNMDVSKPRQIPALKSKKTHFYWSQILYFSNVNVISFKVGSLSSYNGDVVPTVGSSARGL